MSVTQEKLAALGLVLPAPVAIPEGVTLPFPFVNVRGNRAFVSGHGPQNTDGSLATPFGKLGREVSVEQGYELARKTGLSMLASLQRELGDLEQRSWWLNLESARRVAFEAGGRHLKDLRLWRDGSWLVDAALPGEVAFVGGINLDTVSTRSGPGHAEGDHEHVHDVYLELLSAEAEIGAHQIGEDVHLLLAPESRGVELQIEGRTRGVFTFGFIRNLMESKGNVSAQNIQDYTAEYIESEGLSQHPQLVSKSFLGTRSLKDLFVSTPRTLLAGLEDPRPPFRVEVWVTAKGKNSFLIGEKLVFSVRSERKGYLYLLAVDSQKTVTLLFPNHLDRDNYITAGTVATVPGAEFLSEILADEPVGQDTIIAVVSTRPWKELERMEIDEQNIMAILNEQQISEVVAGALTRSATRGVSIRPKPTEAETAGAMVWALGKIGIEIRR